MKFNLKLKKLKGSFVGWKPECPGENHPTHVSKKTTASENLTKKKTKQRWSQAVATILQSSCDLLLPVFSAVMTWQPWNTLIVRPEQSGCQRVGPSTGALRYRHPLAIFCYQVFFDNDPSSAASLLSSADISARRVKWQWTVRVRGQCSVCECVRQTGPRLGALRRLPILLRSSATRCSLITFLLLRPVFISA